MDARFQIIINNIIFGLKELGGEAAQLGEEILTFLGITGPAGFKVATDVLTDVATKTVTPAQAISQFQDVTALGAAANQAIATIKAEQQAPAA